MSFRLMCQKDRLVSILLSDGDFVSPLSRLPDYFKSHAESCQDENIKFTFDVTRNTFENAINGIPKNLDEMFFTDFLGLNIKNIKYIRINITELTKQVCDILEKNNVNRLKLLLCLRIKGCPEGSLVFLSNYIVSQLFNYMNNYLEDAFYIFRATKNETFIKTFYSRHNYIPKYNLERIKTMIKDFDQKEQELVKIYIINNVQINYLYDSF